MKFIPHREKESNFIIHFFADFFVSLASLIMNKFSPYALMYTVEWEEEDEVDE